MHMTIEIEKVENGYLVTMDERRWVASDEGDVKDILEELLAELEDLE